MQDHDIDKDIATQEKRLFFSEIEGNKWKNLAEEHAESQTLSDEQIGELSGIVVGIEKYYGFPVDIEWAYEKENFILYNQGRLQP